MRFGVIGGGSWATALAKILADKGHVINWWIRNEETIAFFRKKSHNPQYLSSARFDTSRLHLSSDVREVVRQSDVLVIAIPSAYAASSLAGLTAADWKGKKVVSAIKGLLPDSNILLNYYMQQEYGLGLEDYFAVLGPCHAEEIAEEKLSYLTFSGIDTQTAALIAEQFSTDYINTVVNHDILGVQYAAVLKNIYALGAGIAHGLDYGDNFLSVYIANAADEMASFLRQFGAEHITVGEHDGEDPLTHRKTPNYAASVYLGDLLVTCYSLHSRNRRFGNMIGRGYSVKSAELEMNMVAEGYNAARCICLINQSLGAPIPIAETIYKILWEDVKPSQGFSFIETVLV
ncbi:MAG: NAD(P)-binding domain-containing protein [Chitinophagales bacterium]|nr:NAD(P)-binding domain-containing protein [Chitinophagales bacterium]